MPVFFVENFGCRATQADGAAIERELAGNGHALANRAEHADVVVLNSCTVTAAADADLRARVRRIHRNSPQTKILVTGCYAQRAPEEVGALPGVACVVGNSHKSEVARIAATFAGSVVISPDVSPARPVSSDWTLQEGISVTNHFHLIPPNQGPASGGFVSLGQLTGSTNLPEAQFTLVGDIFAHTQLMAAPVFDSSPEGKTRPNLKVQDGCGNRCSFCVIPFVRGNSRSLPLLDVIRECNALVALGHKEVVISGINLGRWGRDFAKPLRFEQLLRAILAETDLPRLRISSVEPMDWSRELIELMAGSQRIAQHAHVPLQSGSDRVLRMMHRKYRPWHYAEKMRRLREAMPDAAIGADVMVGFPGETDELFNESLDFISRMPFTYLHVFTFSLRPGTAAAAMPGQVSTEVAKERNQVLRALAEKKGRAFRDRFLGRRLDCVTLNAISGGATEALSHNFLKLRIAGELPPNQLLSPLVTAGHNDGLSAIQV